MHTSLEGGPIWGTLPHQNTQIDLTCTDSAITSFSRVRPETLPPLLGPCLSKQLTDQTFPEDPLCGTRGMRKRQVGQPWTQAASQTTGRTFHFLGSPPPTSVDKAQRNYGTCLNTHLPRKPPPPPPWLCSGFRETGSPANSTSDFPVTTDSPPFLSNLNLCSSHLNLNSSALPIPLVGKEKQCCHPTHRFKE